MSRVWRCCTRATPSSITRSRPNRSRGVSLFREGERALLGAFSGVRLKKRRVLTGESTIVVELVLTATNTGAIELSPCLNGSRPGRNIDIPSVWVLEMDHDGLIAEERDYFDTGALFRQLGLQE